MYYEFLIVCLCVYLYNCKTNRGVFPQLPESGAAARTGETRREGRTRLDLFLIWATHNTNKHGHNLQNTNKHGHNKHNKHRLNIHNIHTTQANTRTNTNISNWKTPQINGQKYFWIYINII